MSVPAYLTKAGELLEAIQAGEHAGIGQAAAWCAETVRAAGIVHLFGSGHSALPAKEAYVRAGMLTCFRAFGLDPVIGRLERVEGIGHALLENEDLRPGEVVIVISHSGINPLPLEVAMEARARGLRTVGVSSLAHSQASVSRHSSGCRLFEVVDLSIDTHAPLGDACLDLPGMPLRVGPLSTLAGILIINSIVVETASRLLGLGVVPPIRISRNTPEGDEHNRRFIELYGERIPELRW
jgi:uncharacterized phosphosugar-binding protein